MTFPPPEDFSGLFEGLERIQRQLADAEAATAHEEVIGSAGGGAVRIHASGDFVFTKVDIDPTALAGGDLSLVEDLVLAALHDAVTQLTAARDAAMGSVVSDAFGALFGSIGAEGGDPDALPEEFPPGLPGELPPAKD